MGRPRQHTETTADALLDAAERLLHERGTDGLALRDVAAGAATSTRAVYSLFGSKEALLGALGARAMRMLHQGVDDVPVTGDPRRDLVEAALVFRSFALEHPALFEVAFQRADRAASPQFRTAGDEALAALRRRFEPLAAAGLLGGRALPQAVLAFHCLCEGMAALELRGRGAQGNREWMWRDAFWALLKGFAA